MLDNDVEIRRWPDDWALVEQARRVKAVNNETKVWVYRQGQGAGSPKGNLSTEILTDPKYDGFFLKYPNGSWLPGRWKKVTPALTWPNLSCFPHQLC